MFALFYREEDSKPLYFRLNSAFHLMSNDCSHTYKFAGLYAIYKDNACYYVGQSKNLPSRLATHLTGKYSVADEVHIFIIGEDSFGGFYERDKETQKKILENNERWLISELQPIENLLVEDCELDVNKLCDPLAFCASEDEEYIFHSSIRIYLTDFDISVVSVDGSEIIPSIPETIKWEWRNEQESIQRFMDPINEEGEE